MRRASLDNTYQHSFAKRLSTTTERTKKSIGKLKRTGELKTLQQYEADESYGATVTCSILCNADREMYVNDVFPLLCGNILGLYNIIDFDIKYKKD